MKIKLKMMLKYEKNFNRFTYNLNYFTYSAKEIAL